MKIKLLPSLHEKRRYLVFFIKESGNIKSIIDEALLNWLGILGYAKAGPQLIETKRSEKGSYFILNIEHLYIDSVKAALSFKARCLGVSGTLKKAREKFLKGKI
jgi:RNase P/RNase MRP subunit POP5